MANKRVWDEKKIDYLRKHYPDGDTDDIAFTLGHTVDQIRAAAYSLGIKKSDASKRAIRLKSLTLGKEEEQIELPKGAIHRKIHSGSVTIIGKVLTHRAM